MTTVVKRTEIGGIDAGWTASAVAEARTRRARCENDARLLSVISDSEAVWNKLLFPTPKLEGWRYTNPESIAKGQFHLAPLTEACIAEADLCPFMIEGLNAARIVFVDGALSESLSNRDVGAGCVIARVGDSSESLFGSLSPHVDDSFAALATTLLTDGISIAVARGAAVARPIHVVCITTKASERAVIAPRVFVDAGENSQVTIVESHVSLGGEEYLSLPVVEVKAADAAVVDYYRYQDEATSAYHVSNTVISQGRSGSVSMHLFSFGGSLVRNNVTSLLKGSGAHAVVNGLSVLSGTQHVDNSTCIHHQEPSIESRELFKGIYADSSRGVFSGTITVDQIAQKTNAFQSNQALLLSSDASVETRPQLKIWADDVKCTHGATVGQLNEEAMFYLRSRGISKEDARNFLIHAFASEVLSSVKVPAMREYIEGRISRALGR